MNGLSILVVLVLGGILGSFLNALLFRFNTGQGIGGRSHCMQCGHTLKATDLIPVFSFLFLRGRCRYCGAKISIQYPFVEIAAALLSLAAYLAHPAPFEYALWFVILMTLLFIVVYDIRHGIIPWSASGLLVVLSLAHLFFLGDLTLWSVLAGPLLALPLLLFSLISKGTWMGWGDGVLELPIGWLLGLSVGATALFLAFWSGALVGVALILLKRGYVSLGAHIPVARSEKNVFFSLASLGYTMKSELPFAPFLVLGALVAHFFHVDFFASFSLLLEL